MSRIRTRTRDLEITVRVGQMLAYVLGVGIPLGLVVGWAFGTGAPGSVGAATLAIAAFVVGLVLHIAEWTAVRMGPHR